MSKNLLLTFAVALAIVSTAKAQPGQRRATLRGDGNPGEGKCTIEVIVDGAVDLEIRGDSAVLRNLSGRAPQWRLFECTAVMPESPYEFQVRGVDGRGTVQLVRDPRDGGVAIMRIEDPQGGAEGYRLDIFWRARAGNYNGPRNNSPGMGGSHSNQRRDTNNQQQKMNNEFSPDQAVRLCEEGVRQEAAGRLGLRNIQFRGTALDDRSDRQDRVLGSFATGDRGETYRFSCTVDFGAGRIQAVQIDPAPGDPYASNGSGNFAVRSCQNDIQARLQRLGYNNVEFRSIDRDNRAGREDWLLGNVTGDRGNRPNRFAFSCRMNLNGTVRSANVSKK